MNTKNTVRAEDIMIRKVVTVTPETPLLEASQKMLEGVYSGLPVIDANRKLVGLVTDYDFLTKGTAMHLPTFLKIFGHYQIGKGDESLMRGELKDMLAFVVRDIMNVEPITLGETATLTELVDVFSKHHRVNPLPVVDKEGMLVGIVTRYDVIKFYAETLRKAGSATGG